MKYEIKRINVIISLFLIIPILTYVGQVKAEDTTITGDIGSGSSSGVSGYYDALWSGHLYEFEFRVTLVDADGEKVQNTNSVDYGYNNDSKTYQLTGNDLTNKIRTAIGYNTVTGTYNYEYKYGTNTDNYSYYKAKLANGNYYNYYSQYETFVQEFQTIIRNRTKQFGIGNNTTGNFDFLTMFLYHCGFLTSDDGNYYDIDDNKWSNKKNEIAMNNYYILIEPIFTISGTYSKHGTSNEMAKFLISTGTIPYGLMSAFTYTLGMGMNTNAVDIQNLGFKRVKYGDYNLSLAIFKKGGASNAQVIDEWRYTSNPEYGYGIGVLRISAIIGDISPIKRDIYFSNDYCGETSDGKNTGKMILNLNNSLDEDIFTYLEKAGINFKKYNSSNSSIYCYDDVTYDFNNIINTLNTTTAKTSSNITIPTGTVIINRKCKVNSPDIEYNTAKTTFMNNFDEYENQNIPLNVYNKTIELKKADIKTTTDDSNLKTILGSKKGLYNVTATITFGYKENESKIYVDKNYGDGTASIDLSNATFGYSNDLKNQIQDGQTYTYNNISFNTHVTSNTENYVCSFKTPVETPDNPPNTEEKYTTPAIQFRTIDLENPFPARDGSSRLPGTNWLGKDNYVRAYIKYNRGVSGNEVYNKEPIYTITLTPSDIIKIREYNKKNDYSDINKDLICFGEKNTSCLSTFLSSLDKVEGSCSSKNLETIGLSLKEDPNGIKNANSKELEDNITEIYDKNASVFRYNYNSDQLQLDFNNDKILTLRDAYIYDFADKTTSFYTCADKTYENSGYMRKEQ